MSNNDFKTAEISDWEVKQFDIKLKQKKFVYFLHPAEGGPIKIGLAADPRKRHTNLKNTTPFKTDLLAQMPGDKFSEAYLHTHFRRRRINGEWFAPNAELWAAIIYIKEHGNLPWVPTYEDVGMPSKRGAVKIITDQLGLTKEEYADVAGYKPQTLSVGLSGSTIATSIYASIIWHRDFKENWQT